jgi:hypothetical protein
MSIIGPILVNIYKHLKIVQKPAMLKTLSASNVLSYKPMLVK